LSGHVSGRLCGRLSGHKCSYVCGHVSGRVTGHEWRHACLLTATCELVTGHSRAAGGPSAVSCKPSPARTGRRHGRQDV
jgi:hypothetical protein